jgi:signal transduction histidine kinase
VRIAAFPMRGTTWMQAASRDISDRIRHERELAEAVQRAESFARQAESANAAKTTFIANMSHEIRTPLNGVIGMLGMLRDDDLTSAQREYTDTARAAANQLLALINDLLDVARIEAGKLELTEVEFDPGAVARRARGAVRAASRRVAPCHRCDARRAAAGGGRSDAATAGIGEPDRQRAEVYRHGVGHRRLRGGPRATASAPAQSRRGCGSP